MLAIELRLRLAGAPDIEHLRTLSQPDLAIALCERWGWGAFSSGNKTQPPYEK
jgi:hypothetical protein